MLLKEDPVSPLSTREAIEKEMLVNLTGRLSGAPIDILLREK